MIGVITLVAVVLACFGHWGVLAGWSALLISSTLGDIATAINNHNKRNP